VKKTKLNPAKILYRLNLLFLLSIFLLGFRAGVFDTDKKELTNLIDNQVVITGRVCEEADVGISNRRLTICTSEKILITTDLYPAYEYGDYLQISGQLLKPPEVDGFNYQAYLARYSIYYVMYNPNIEISPGHVSVSQGIYKIVLSGKKKIKSIIDSNLPEPEAGLASALLLGYRRTMVTSDSDIFARIGLSHMIAISGSHITIMSAMIVSCCLALGFTRKRTWQAVYFFLLIYPLITGLAASAVRSSIMGGLAFAAISGGRLSSMLRALVFSASAMLLFNPKLLRDDLGFQLSFLALLGIIYFYPLAEKKLNQRIVQLKMRLGAKRFLKMMTDLIVLTMVSQLVILPIALINFQQLSLIAPLANVLVIWTFPLLLSSLIIAILASLIWSPLGLLWFYPAHLLLEYIFAISNILAKPDWAAISVTWFNWYYGAAYYFILIIILQVFKPKNPFRREKVLDSIENR